MKDDNDELIGKILMAQGAITEEQLKDARKRQQTRTSDTRLGDVLVSFSYITPEDLALALAEQFNVEFVDLGSLDISPGLISSFPVEFARVDQVIPIREEGNKLIVAMRDPMNLGVIDKMRLFLDRDIQPVVASPDSIKAALKKYYDVSDYTVERALTELSCDSLESLSTLSQEDLSSLTQFDPALMGDEEIEGPVVRLVTMLIVDAHSNRASDIHIEPFENELKVRYRIDGVLQEMDSPPKKLQNSILSRLKIMAGMDITERRSPQDGRIKLQLMGKDVDLRASALPGIHGESFVLRILDKSSLTLDLADLGYEKNTLRQWKELLDIPNGLILVTGPTGSGKTTTLYASLGTLNTPERKIITIENPVEYVLSGINQVQIIGDIGLTFSTALRSMLRQSPDIVMIGEIRDVETAEIAVGAAMTGHLVFSTLHTNDAAGALNRLIDLGVMPFKVASAIRAASAQRLVRKICTSCKTEYRPTDCDLKLAGLNPEEVQGKSFFKGEGCENCNGTGYYGRTTVLELLKLSPHLRELVLKHTPTTDLKKAARIEGMKTLREDALLKVYNGTTTLEEAVAITQEDEDSNTEKAVEIHPYWGDWAPE